MSSYSPAGFQSAAGRMRRRDCSSVQRALASLSVVAIRGQKIVRPRTLRAVNDWLSAAARTRPAHPALVAGGRTISYAELDARCDSLAATLPQGRVLELPAAGGLEFAERLHATWRARSAAA